MIVPALLIGIVAGLRAMAPLAVVGAVIGTLGGAAVRARLVRAFGRGLPAALIEDAVAIGAALLIAAAL